MSAIAADAVECYRVARLSRLAVLLLLCGAALAQERAFVEVTAPKEAYYAGERVRLKLRFGYDREFFRTSAVPLFPRRMDLPVHVKALWQDLPGTVPPTGGLSFALNDDLSQARQIEDVVRDGRVFTVFETEKIHVPPEPGDLQMPAPRLRYVYATQFDEDFVNGRVAKDPTDAVVTGAPLNLRILPLPDEGRPPEFQGAVGRFTVRAEADRAAVDEGGILRLTFTIEGEGETDAPQLVLPGFHVYGTMDEGGRGGRAVKYDIAPLSADVNEIPAIPFAFFDPGPPAAYKVARTQPIPLEVRRRRPAEAPPTSPSPSPIPIPALVVATVLLLCAAAFAVWFRRRPPAEAPPDPDAIRAAEARARVHALAASPGPDLAEAFAEYLAAHLKCPAAAVIGPDLKGRLVARGLDAPLAARAATALDRLVAAGYGGHPTEAVPPILPLLEEIEAALSGRSGSGA